MYANQAEWLAGVKDWLDVANYSDTRVNVWLQMANARLNKDLNSRHMEETTPYTVLAGDVTNGYIDLSTALVDFNRMINVNVKNGQSILVVAINEFTDLVAAGVSGTASIPPAPCYYCVVGNQLSIYSFPAEGLNLVLTHYTMVPGLSPTVDANAFTINHFNAFLWATLAYGSKFIVEDDRGTMYENNYLNEVEVINKAAKAEKMGSTPLKRNFSVYNQGGIAV